MTDAEFLESLKCALVASEKVYGKESPTYIMCELMYMQVQMEFATRADKHRIELNEAYNQGYADGVKAKE